MVKVAIFTYADDTAKISYSRHQNIGALIMQYAIDNTLKFLDSVVGDIGTRLRSWRRASRSSLTNRKSKFNLSKKLTVYKTCFHSYLGSKQPIRRDLKLEIVYNELRRLNEFMKYKFLLLLNPTLIDTLDYKVDVCQGLKDQYLDLIFDPQFY